MIDRFEREITFDGARYTCGGITVESLDANEALNTFNAMAPEGWVEPEEAAGD